MKKVNILIAIILTLNITISLYALDIKQAVQSNASYSCVDLVKECFVGSNVKRDDCFFRSAQHRLCRGSDLANLLLTRWKYSNSSIGNYGLARSNVQNNKLVNLRCVAGIDNRLAAALFSGALYEHTIHTLITDLSTCREKSLIDLMHP